MQKKTEKKSKRKQILRKETNKNNKNLKENKRKQKKTKQTANAERDRIQIFGIAPDPGFCSGRALRKIHNHYMYAYAANLVIEAATRRASGLRCCSWLAACMHACIRPFGPAPDPALPGRRPGLASYSAAAARGRRPDACSRGAGASVARASADRDRYRCSIEAAAHVNCIIMIIFLYPWCLRLF